MTFEVYEAADGWRWRARARNGRIMADGAEAYVTEYNAGRAVERFVEQIGGTFPGWAR